MTAIVDNYYDQRRQEGPITSGFISNSDIRQKEKDERIKWERQKGYEEYINKYRPPVNSLPIGRYEETRRSLDEERHKEYNLYMSKKKEAEQIRREKMYMNARDHQPPPEPVEVYDHDQVAKELREERKNEYNDYLKKKQQEERSRIKLRHSTTPTGNLPIGQYDLQRKKLQDQLKNEYKESLMKREQENQINRRKHPYTPPTGLNIATEQDRKRVEDMKKSTYREELLKQQQDQLYQRALRDGDVHVANRTSPTQAPPDRTSPRGRPPQHPNSGRRRDMQNYMDQSRQTPKFFNEGRQALSPKSEDRLESPYRHYKHYQTERKTEDELRTGFFDDRRKSPPNRDERRNDYADFLADKEQKMALERQKREELRKEPYPEVVKGDYYNADTLEQKRRHLNDARREEYQNYLSTQRGNRRSSSGNDSLGTLGLPLFQEKYDDHYKNLKKMRNEEYNQLLGETNQPTNRLYTPADLQGLPISQRPYDVLRQNQEKQRNKEYNEHLAKKYGQQKPRRMADLSSNNSIGFMSNLGFHERERERLNKEKRDEYNKYLDENAYGRNGMPYGRPNWVDGKVPPDSWYNQDPPPFKGRDDDTQRGRPGSYRRQSPSYQEILDSKRRQEASYRRFDDQEYSRGAPLNQDYARQQDGYNIHGRYE